MGDSSEILRRARALARTYGAGDSAVTAVRNASFEIRSGDEIALAGPSGSGKTTLLHLLAALDQPTGGSIEWPALGPADALRPGPVAVGFQGPSLLPPLTVLENVALPLLLLDEPEEQAMARAQAMLDRFGLRDGGSRLPEALSGSQTQRAGLARAVAGRPRLLLADEPTGQQDGETAAAVMDALLSSVRDAAAALVVATHDPRVARRMDVRWEMRDGSLDTGVAASSR